MDVASIQQFKEQTGMQFTNSELLQTALTHSSYARGGRRKSVMDNERLEFFGDAVLKLVVSDYLYQKFPSYSEGELTKLRAQLISDKNLAYLADKLGVGRFIRLSSGEKSMGGDKRLSNLANALEALLGAYFLDAGWDAVQHFFKGILTRFESELRTLDHSYDYKTTLQEWAQRQRIALPRYMVDREVGPDHNKVFHVRVVLDTRPTPLESHGEGRSKKDAEQQAAKNALSLIDP